MTQNNAYPYAQYISTSPLKAHLGVLASVRILIYEQN